MDFAFTEEQQAIAELAARIIGDASTHERLRELERADAPRFDRDLWATLAEAGVLGAFVPESAGGAGLDVVALGAVCEAVGRHTAAVPLWETLGLAALPIARFAPNAVASRWLGPVAAGEVVLTAAWHDDGGDLLTPSVTATADGDQWRLNGLKVCVPYGAEAQALLVVASRAGGSLGVFLVERGGDGVVTEPLDSTAGTPEATLILTDAPATPIAEGIESVRWCLDLARATQCAVAEGVAARAVELTAQYTKERKQFDQPLASFQAVTHRAADAYIDAEGIRLTTRQALWRLAEGLPASEEVDIATFWAAWGGQRVVHAATHLHGGVGVDRDYPLHRCFLWAKQLELQLGGATRSLLSLGRSLAS